MWGSMWPCKAGAHEAGLDRRRHLTMLTTAAQETLSLLTSWGLYIQSKAWHGCCRRWLGLLRGKLSMTPPSPAPSEVWLSTFSTCFQKYKCKPVQSTWIQLYPSLITWQKVSSIAVAHSWNQDRNLTHLPFFSFHSKTEWMSSFQP